MAFRFKQFSVDDEQSCMKVGTDAVLLGAYAGRGNPARILDIGTGCGLISLMMAQRFRASNILAIDIHRPSIVQARENFAKSLWAGDLSAEHISLQEYSSISSSKFDLIVSNPPFFADSLLPQAPSKKLARHTATLSYNEIVEGVCRLMDAEGSLSLILPFASQDLFEKVAIAGALHKSRQLIIIPVEGKNPNRVLSEWRFQTSYLETDSLTIRNNTHTYSQEYIQLTQDFYLAL